MEQIHNDCICIFGLKKVNVGGSLKQVSQLVMEQRVNIKFCFKIAKMASLKSP